MRNLALLALVVSCGPAKSPSATDGPAPASLAVRPPMARVVPLVEEKFGIRVEDNYRWMETNDEELTQWLHGQGAHTRKHLDQVAAREQLVARIRELVVAGTSYGKVSRRGTRLFYTRIRAGERVAALVTREGSDGAEKTLVDPNTSSELASIDNLAPSPDGKLVAYNLSPGGSEISSIRVVDVSSGEHRTDVVDKVWGEFEVTWHPDGGGFFYTQMDPKAFSDKSVDKLMGMRLRFHRLGADPKTDPVVLGGTTNATMAFEPHEFPFIEIPQGSSWALAFAGGARSDLRLSIARVEDLKGAKTSWTSVADYDDRINSVGVHGDTLYLQSTKDAPNGKVLRVAAANPNIAEAQTVLAERPDAVLRAFWIARTGLFVSYLDSGVARLSWLKTGASAPTTVKTPFVGNLSAVETDPSTDDEVWFWVTSWTKPGGYLRWSPGDAVATETALKREAKADFSKIIAERIEVASFDGTQVPLTIVRNATTTLDGSSPLVLNGYGGYGIALLPRFSSSRLAWLERGGIFAVAHVRGGGEKGRAWHEGGKGKNKENGVRDFLACADYLVSNGYTSRRRIAAAGGSMGGVLVGGALTSRPDAFAAAVIDVGVLNVTRILEAQNGANQITELGGHPDNEAGFRILAAMDPYHRIAKGTKYPPTLLVVGLNDNRVEPWQSAKFAARLRAANVENSVHIRTDVDGHGVGSTRNQAAEQFADRYAFLIESFGLAESSGK